MVRRDREPMRTCADAMCVQRDGEGALARARMVL